MVFNKLRLLSSQKSRAGKLTLGFASITAVAVIGSAGIAAAESSNGDSDSDSSNPKVVAFCKDHFKELGFTNVGRCVSHLNGHGHGYGYGDRNDNDHGDENDNDQGHHHHFHFHNFVADWWHSFEHD